MGFLDNLLRGPIENLVGAIDPNAAVSYTVVNREGKISRQTNEFQEFQSWLFDGPEGHLLFVICKTHGGDECPLYMWREAKLIFGMLTSDERPMENPTPLSGNVLMFQPNEHGEVVPRMYRKAEADQPVDV